MHYAFVNSAKVNGIFLSVKNLKFKTLNAKNHRKLRSMEGTFHHVMVIRFYNFLTISKAKIDGRF